MESQVDMQVFLQFRMYLSAWLIEEHVIEHKHSKCNRLTEREEILDIRNPSDVRDYLRELP